MIGPFPENNAADEGYNDRGDGSGEVDFARDPPDAGDDVIKKCGSVRNSAEGPIFKVVVPQDESGMCDDSGDTGHAGVAIGIDEIDLVIDEDLLRIPETGGYDEAQGEEKKKPAFHWNKIHWAQGSCR